jgi:zinc transporter ZupT
MAILHAFGAGNFIYIGASDLIPLMRSKYLYDQLVQFIMFLAGILIMFILTN